MTDAQKLDLLATPETRELLDRVMNPVDLHPDLVPYLQESELLGMILKHPLVFQIPYSPTLNSLVNDTYERKRQAIPEMLEAKRFGAAIWLHERPYRVSKLKEYEPLFTDNGDFWEVFGRVYTDSENISEVQGDFAALLACERPGRENMMRAPELEAVAQFPDELTVYRGHCGDNEMGFSWTLSYLQALWFARREGGSLVSWARIQKEDIVGFFHRRREMDILIHPDNLNEVCEFTLPRDERPARFEDMLTITIEAFALDPVSTAHGPDHWQKVEHNGMAICQLLPEADANIVRAFALTHDCRRENEHKDPDHGHRAADFFNSSEELIKLMGFTVEQREKLDFALRYHNDGQISDDPTIGACWDADRLDLVRVGYVPDPKLFSTTAGRDLIFKN